MKKILTLKNEKLIFNKIYVLKDGRIIAHNDCKEVEDVFLCFIFDLKNDKCFNLNFKKINEIIEMHDGVILIVVESEIILLDIKKENFEIIQTLKIEATHVFKLTNEKILIKISKNLGNIFIYKNKILEFEKQINLNCLKKFLYLIDNFALNEKEIILSYCEDGFFSFKRYVGFFDLETDKKIKSFEVGVFGKVSFELINNKTVIVGSEIKVFPIDLTNHSKKKVFTLQDYNYINSIVALNEKEFIVGQNNYINHLELDKDYKINLINTIKLDNNYLFKYPKSRLLIRSTENHQKTLFLYG